MRTLNFRFEIDGVSDNTLVVRQFQGDEFISDGTDGQGQTVFGYRYHIDLASRNSMLAAKQIVDRKALLEILRDGQVVRRVHGTIRNFTKGDTGFNHTFYSVTLVPALERLSLRHNSRIFQKKDVQEILTTLLSEMGISDYAFSIRRTLSQREFCVQYRETDVDFFQRLAAEEGLMYFFEHEATKHTLVITDNPEGFKKSELSVPYNALSGGASDVPYISGMQARTQTEASSVYLQDYSFKKPDYSFAQQQDGKAMEYQQQTYEYFDHPGRFKDDGNGKAFTQVRLEYLRREAYTVTGTSDESRIVAGYRFDLQEHVDEAMNRCWLAVAVSHQGSQPQALEEEGSSGATTYSNQFKLIPGDQVWRARPQPKPQVDGPCIAKVVGPAGEEIYCDEHGRVKLHFPWDRESNMDDKSSCWVRVSQAWAGSQSGMMIIPRVGHEVIVSFLNGDPDQPIVTGRTFHATNQPPYPLPAGKTKTVWRSDSHQGKGSNEISFEDQAGSEQVYVHAQNDYKIEVGHDKHQEVTNMEDHKIGKDYDLNIGQDYNLTVEGNLTKTVTGKDVCKVTGTQEINVTKVRDVKIWDNDIHFAAKEQHWTVDGLQTVKLNAGQDMTVIGKQTENYNGAREANVHGQYDLDVDTSFTMSASSSEYTATSGITIGCGESVITLEPGGISISSGGSSIVLNSGGIFLDGSKIELN